jgi:hypothetical protein
VVVEIGRPGAGPFLFLFLTSNAACLRKILEVYKRGAGAVLLIGRRIGLYKPGRSRVS